MFTSVACLPRHRNNLENARGVFSSGMTDTGVVWRRRWATRDASCHGAANVANTSPAGCNPSIWRRCHSA